MALDHPRSRKLCCLISSVMSLIVRSRVVVLSPAVVPPPGLSGHSWKSATFKYLGPQHDFAVNGTAMLIDSICDANKWPSVEGKVIVFAFESRSCTLDGAYKNIRKSNAVAAIESFPFDDHPDMNAMVHSSWNRCRFCHDSIPFVRISDPKKRIRRLLLRHGDLEVVLKIMTPHETSMVKMYESMHWFIVLQILLPVYAFATATMAGLEFYRELHSDSFKARGPYSVRFVICALEAPTVVMVGCALALGQYGPRLLPQNIHIALFTSFSGISLFTSLTFAVYLQDEMRHFNSNAGRQQPRRSFWDRRCALISGALFGLVGFDIFFVVFVISKGISFPAFPIFFGAYSTFVVLPVSCFVAGYFIYQV